METHHEYGVCLPFKPLSQSFEYMIGLAVGEDADTKDYAVTVIPAATFAVFSVPTANDKTFVESIQGTWNYIFNEWFPTSGYEFDDASYDYEFYRVDSIDDATQRCDIYLPVKKV